jgi:hypothetical protein
MAITRGLDITRASWSVLRKDRELFIFPVLSAISGIAIVVTILSAGYLMPGFGEWLARIFDNKQPHSLSEQILGGLCLFLVYFVEWVVAVYFNTALVGCAIMRFEGGDPTIADGFRIANRRLPQILAWALFAAVVGTLLSAIEQKLGWIGKIVIRFIGLAWAVATYFVVPVLAEEGVGPITAVQRSVGLLKKTWGEALVGNITIQLGSFGLLFLMTLFLLGGIFLAVYLESLLVAIITGAIFVVILLIFAIVTSALKQVFLAGLYQYAKSGRVPDGFSEQMMQSALKGLK